jgi:Cytochrome c.
MADQPQYDPYEASTFYPDGMSARQPVAGTVARGTFHDDDFLYTGKVNGVLVDSFPAPVTRDVLLRGEERFNIYCSECHGRRGLGDGMIVRRGFRHPPSYHDSRIRALPVGHYFDVMTNGFGAMPSYAAQVTVNDRWAIAAYIRALQLSHNAPLAVVPPAERAKLEGVTR